MQTHFNDVFHKLGTQIDSRSGEQSFKTMQHLSSTFTTYRSAHDVLDVLRNQKASHDEKDKLLYECVMLKRENGPLSEFAGILLIVAMRPVLFSLCMQINRSLQNPRETLNEVVAAFFDTVESWNPEKVDRVAVNLKWKVRKTAIEKRRQEQREREILSRFAEEQTHQIFAYPSEDTPWQSSDVEIVNLKQKLKFILDWSSRDLDLLVLRLVMESSWQVVGFKTGLKPESARKRCRLLKRKLRAMNLSDALETNMGGF